MRRLAPVLLFVATAAAAQDAGLGGAMQDFNAGRNARAAIGFRRALEAAQETDGAQAEYFLAQSLERLGFAFGAFFHYAGIVRDRPSHKYWLEAVDGAARTASQLRDDVVAPNLFEKVYGDRLDGLAPGRLAAIRTSLALLAWRAGRYEDVARLVRLVPDGSAGSRQARYLTGLLQQRTEPEKAVETFRALAALPRASSELRELSFIALGRTLYALHRYPEASAAYEKLPRFSRHWDEALFEGAYANMMMGDPGAALGKLHSLHSPHLHDEFVPESLNLTAILYQQRCLYPQVRSTIAQFDREYLPMRDQMKGVLQGELPLAEYWRMLSAGDSRLPTAVQHHLQKNERVSAMRAYLEQLDGEAARVRAEPGLAGSALKNELLEAIARQKELSAQLAGKFVQGRLADMVRLIDVLQGDRELIAFETTKGEKEMLETRFDAEAQLASQRLYRPAIPPTGHEYWPFDGEYWPDEIGYYRYTVKDACPAGRDE
jgi:tetratricopeptide (TPR) repeat protein